MFTPIPLYLKIYVNRMELERVDMGTKVSELGNPPFSSSRLLIAEFEPAVLLLKTLLRRAGIKATFFSPAIHIVVQAMEKTEGGLSTVEKRAFRDLAEMVGASKIRLVDNHQLLAHKQVVALLNQKEAI